MFLSLINESLWQHAVFYAFCFPPIFDAQLVTAGISTRKPPSVMTRVDMHVTDCSWFKDNSPCVCFTSMSCSIHEGSKEQRWQEIKAESAEGNMTLTTRSRFLKSLTTSCTDFTALFLIYDRMRDSGERIKTGFSLMNALSRRINYHGPQLLMTAASQLVLWLHSETAQTLVFKVAKCWLISRAATSRRFTGILFAIFSMK